ncbi:MAG TPA: signal peptidase II [Planctomycetaceae bacterium]|nr:signal peptidase II [Planctomycetaceae bacterium]
MELPIPGLARRAFPVLIPAIVLCSCVGCDQWTKSLATEHLRQAPAMSFLGGMLRIQYAENPGAFLGAGSDLPPSARFALLVIVNGVFLALIAGLILIKRPAGHAQHLAVVLLLAGGIGNLIDRLFHNGLVIDFLNVGIGSLRTGIFNVADMAIMAGFAILILYRGSADSTRDSAARLQQTETAAP